MQRHHREVAPIQNVSNLIKAGFMFAETLSVETSTFFYFLLFHTIVFFDIL